MSEKPLVYTVVDLVARFTINREKQRNSLTGEVVDLFMEYLARAEADKGIRAVLITGTGDKAFCSGADLGGAVKGDNQDPYQRYAYLLKRITGFSNDIQHYTDRFHHKSGIGRRHEIGCQQVKGAIFILHLLKISCRFCTGTYQFCIAIRSGFLDKIA
mgnify:CR=1 FL=1